MEKLVFQDSTNLHRDCFCEQWRYSVTDLLVLSAKRSSESMVILESLMSDGTFDRLFEDWCHTGNDMIRASSLGDIICSSKPSRGCSIRGLECRLIAMNLKLTRRRHCQRPVPGLVKMAKVVLFISYPQHRVHSRHLLFRGRS